MATKSEIEAERKRLQGEMKSAMSKIDAIKAGAQARGTDYTEAELKSIDNYLNAGDQIKIKMGLLGREEELNDWAHSSGGLTSVQAGFVADPNANKSGDDAVNYWRNAGPLEGQLTNDAVVKMDWKSGNLIGENRAGEILVAKLGSGAYKDALNRALRYKATGNDRFAIKGDAMKVLTEGVDTDTGLWVTPEFNATLVKKIATMTTVRPKATVFTTGTDQISFPKVVYTTDDKYTSGVRGSWTAEAPSSNISEATNPSAGRVKIDIFTRTAALLLTRANMEDTQFDLLGLCSMLMSEDYALSENDAFWNGTGAGSPQGILKHPNATTASTSAGMYVPSGAAAALDWGVADSTKGLLGMDGALPPQYDRGAEWYGSKATFANVRAMVDGAGRPLWSEASQYPNYTTGQPAMLLGYPVNRDNFLPAVGANTYPLVLGDLSGYWIADRVGITIEVLRELFALRDIVCIYARRRLGGQLVHDWRVKVQKVATT